MSTKGSRHKQRGSARDRIADLLMQATGPLTTDEIAARLHVSRGHISGRLAELEAEGWIARERAEGGRRSDSWTWRHLAAA